MYLSPFAELVYSGMNVAVDVLRQDVAVLRCMVRDNSAVPREEKKVSAKGKLTSKTMAVSMYWGVYQDYVCGCALRVARETFALLPVPRVVINVAIAGLDSSTGHDAESTILAVSVPREIAESERSLDARALTPSAATPMANGATTKARRTPASAWRRHPPAPAPPRRRAPDLCRGCS